MMMVWGLLLWVLMDGMGYVNLGLELREWIHLFREGEGRRRKRWGL